MLKIFVSHLVGYCVYLPDRNIAMVSNGSKRSVKGFPRIQESVTMNLPSMSRRSHCLRWHQKHSRYDKEGNLLRRKQSKKFPNRKAERTHDARSNHSAKAEIQFIFDRHSSSGQNFWKRVQHKVTSWTYQSAVPAALLAMGNKIIATNSLEI